MRSIEACNKPIEEGNTKAYECVRYNNRGLLKSEIQAYRSISATEWLKEHTDEQEIKGNILK